MLSSRKNDRNFLWRVRREILILTAHSTTARDANAATPFVDMGYEPSHGAAARLSLIYNTTRDTTLRHMLACALDHALVPGTTSMSIHSSGLAPALTQHHGFGDRFPAGPMVTAEAELRTTPRRDPWESTEVEESWFPADNLWSALATPAVVRGAMEAVSAQSRALAAVLQAHREGAATLPPELLATIDAALAAGSRAAIASAA